MVFGFGRGGRGAKKSWGCRKGRGGPPSHCVCSACGVKLPHVPGEPCFKRLCPECGSPMTRQLVEEDR
ncbi:hypothetical protein [Syntrophotalea carbinolica]|uniref:hypothetical protein n=1 Tax=Syntrophotalea carbinolica TaxID=19 RepID=UPI0011D1715C|nr:hypothetical protein [Syntrophotalea carbinolica]